MNIEKITILVSLIKEEKKLKEVLGVSFAVREQTNRDI